MIDIVVPLGKGSRWEDNELKFSLRSLEKFGRNFRNIWVIGSRPSWLKNTYWIRAEDRFGHERNIMEKVMIACNHKDISDDFLFWNDDFFLLQEIDCMNYPNYVSADLQTYIERRHRADGYRESMTNTLRILTKQKKGTKMFDIHCPIIYNKLKFAKLMLSVEWRVANGYVIKSLYGNHHDLSTEEMTDMKLHGNFNEEQIAKFVSGRHIFSVGDKAINNSMKNFLTQQFPHKSKYEI